MKSFFEFYDLLKQRRMNEQDGTNTMTDPNMGMNAAAPAGTMTPTDQGGAAPAMGGMDMPMGDMGEEGAVAPEEGKEKPERDQLAPPEGDMPQPEELFSMIDKIKSFVTDYDIGDDEDKDSAKQEIDSQLEALKNNLVKITGVQPADDKDGEDDQSVASNEIPSSPDEIPPGTETAYGGTFGDAAGGGNMFPSNGGGSGDMGGPMAGGSTPGTTGPGALGFGGFSAG